MREAEKLPDDAIAAFPGALCGKYVNIGAAKKWNGDETGPREVSEKANALAQEQITPTPNDGSAHARLAEALAWLGQKDPAMSEIGKARELLPETKDMFDGPGTTQAEAQIHAMFGDAGRCSDSGRIASTSQCGDGGGVEAGSDLGFDSRESRRSRS